MLEVGAEEEVNGSGDVIGGNLEVEGGFFEDVVIVV